MRAHQRAHDAAAGQELRARTMSGIVARAINFPRRVLALRHRPGLRMQFARVASEEACWWIDKGGWKLLNA
jgi:hypothetical protein